MAHDVSGAVWIIDTSSATIISEKPVKVNKILVTWMISSVGVLEFSEKYKEGATASRKVLTMKSAGASTAACNNLSEWIFVDDHIYQNLWLTTATNIDSVYIYTR